MTMWGADVQALIACSQVFDANADLIERGRTTVDSTLQSTPWDGPDAQGFRSEWTGAMSPRLVTIADALRKAASDLLRHSDQQIHASTSAGAGGAVGGPGAGPIGPGAGGPLGPLAGGPFGGFGWGRTGGSDGLQGSASIGSLEGSYLVGTRGNAEGYYYYGPNGVGAGASADGFIGAEGEFSGRADVGDMSFSGEGRGFVGAEGGANGYFHADQNGVHAAGAADGRIGAGGDFSFGHESPYGSGYLEGEGFVGAEAGADGYFHADDQGVRVGGAADARVGAGGDVAFGGELDGFGTYDVEASGFVGGEAEANGHLHVDEQGGELSLEAGARAGAWGDVSSESNVGPVGTSTEASGFVGAEANAGLDSYVEFQENGGISMGGEAHAHAGVGARGGVDGGIDLGDGIFTADAGISGRAGYVGGDGGWDAAIGWDEIGFGVSGDVAAGLGLGGDVSASFSPSGAWEAGSSGLTDLGGAVDGSVGDAISDAGEWATENPPWEMDWNPTSWF